MSGAARGGETTTDATAVRFEDLVALRHGAGPRRRMAVPSVLRPGGFAGRRRGPGLDIHDVRPFAEGDDMRHADPAATARTGRIHVRTFHEERDRAALLVADFRRPMLWATRGRLRSVAGAAALATVGWRIIDAGGKVGLLAVREGGLDHVAVRPRERTMMQIAGALEVSHGRALAGARAGAVDAAARRPIPTEPLHAVLERAARLVPRGGAIVCATGLDAPGAGFEAVVGSIARRRRLVLVLVRDPLETAPPARRFSYFGEDGVVMDGAHPGRGRGRAREASGARGDGPHHRHAGGRRRRRARRVGDHVMDADALVGELRPIRLPAEYATLGVFDALAAFAVAVLVALSLVALLRPLLARRADPAGEAARAVAALRDEPADVQLLGLARLSARIDPAGTVLRTDSIDRALYARGGAARVDPDEIAALEADIIARARRRPRGAASWRRRGVAS